MGGGQGLLGVWGVAVGGEQDLLGVQGGTVGV